jgi:hypothetical protein
MLEKPTFTSLAQYGTRPQRINVQFAFTSVTADAHDRLNICRGDVVRKRNLFKDVDVSGLHGLRDPLFVGPSAVSSAPVSIVFWSRSSMVLLLIAVQIEFGNRGSILLHQRIEVGHSQPLTEMRVD